ncbi:MAG: branched-chain amino acid ABC transporter permease [Candidatus Hodarchaeales archaeon]|jgi:branched-chain amino acid transport system permease protein
MSENRKGLSQETIIGLVLAIPILLLYSYALASQTNKSIWIIGTIAFILVFFVGAISLDLEVGSVGLPNFGKVAFFALGAYISTLLYSVYRWPFYYVPNIGPFAQFLFSCVVALIVASLFGYLVSIPTVKLRADYFAIMTIAGGEVIRLLFQYEKRWLWAPAPIGPPTQVISNRIKVDFTGMYPFNQTLHYFNITIFEDLNLGSVFIWQIVMLIVFVFISIFIYWFVQQIRKSPYGRTLRAIREDDITVTSVGKNIYRFRWQVTTIAACIAGLAGIMYAMTFSAFEAGDFRPFLTFDLYIFIIIGGLGNSRGAFMGTALVQLFLRAAQVEAVSQNIYLYLGDKTPIIGPIFDFLTLEVYINPDNMRLVILGVILILFLLFKPSGLIPEPKTDNEKYLQSLTKEERESSDKAVLARQSLTERDRLEEEDKMEPSSIS